MFNDCLIDSYEDFIKRLSLPIIKRIVYKTKRHLQSLDRKSGMMQSGDDSGLKNVWDEFCVQVQSEFSAFWELYVSLVEDTIRDLVKELSDEEKTILWICTRDYEDEKYQTEQDNEDADYSEMKKATNDLLNYIFEDGICDYLYNEVYEEACNYHTQRIENYL